MNCSWEIIKQEIVYSIRINLDNVELETLRDLLDEVLAFDSNEFSEQEQALAENLCNLLGKVGK